VTLSVVLAVSACSTPQAVTPLPELPEVPTYVKVPHPGNADIHELQALFHSPLAPAPEKLATCDADFRKLQSLTQSRDELAQAAKELVGLQPEAYHWCFYWQFVRLEDSLKKIPYADERQAEVLKTYGFVVPFAKAFRDVFQDTRYARVAAFRYQRASDQVFFRPLALTADGARDLLAAQSLDPQAIWQTMKGTQTPTLDRLGFVKPATEVEKALDQALPAAESAGAAPPPPAPAEATPPAATAQTTPPAATPANKDDPAWQKEFQSMEQDVNGAKPAAAGPPGTAPATAETPAATPPTDAAAATTTPPADTPPSAEAVRAPADAAAEAIQPPPPTETAAPAPSLQGVDDFSNEVGTPSPPADAAH
jgi:hypothetical protein